MEPAQEVCHRAQPAIPEGGRDVDWFRIFAVWLRRFFGGSLPAAIEMLFRKSGTPQQGPLECVHALGVIVPAHVFRRNDSGHGIIIVAVSCKTKYVVHSKLLYVGAIGVGLGLGKLELTARLSHVSELQVQGWLSARLFAGWKPGRCTLACPSSLPWSHWA